MKIVGMLEPLAMPLVKRLPYGFRFPTVIASLFLFLTCLIAGMLAQTRVGRSAGTSLEHVILNRILGYSMARSITRRIGNLEESEKFASALVEIEDALVPAFIVEEHADGRYTVFVASVPTPAVGAIYIIARERVQIVHPPFLNTVKCISGWGVGSTELLQSILHAPESRQQ